MKRQTLAGENAASSTGKNTVETISSYLSNDHARCEALYGQMRLALDDGQWQQAERAFQCLRDALERHMLVEERIVFTIYEKAIHALTAPTAAMRAEHLRLRGIVQRLADVLRLRQMDAADHHANNLHAALQQHHHAEEDKLYPMIERVLVFQQKQVVTAMHQFGAMDMVAKAA